MSRTNQSSLAIDLISEGTIVRGDVEIRSLFRVEGRIEGDIIAASEMSEGSEVYIAPKAVVKGKIVASRVVIEGSVQGDVIGIVAVDLYSSGRLEGGVETPHFTVQPGGVFIGQSKRPQRGSH